jgi:hypothetical protein
VSVADSSGVRSHERGFRAGSEVLSTMMDRIRVFQIAQGLFMYVVTSVSKEHSASTATVEE